VVEEEAVKTNPDKHLKLVWACGCQRGSAESLPRVVRMGFCGQQRVVEETEMKTNPDEHLRLVWACVARSVDLKKESQR
jgi:hypothetical protein